MDFLGSFIGGGASGGDISKEFGSSTATTTFGDNRGGDTSGVASWIPLAVLGGMGFVLALVLILALKK